MKGLGTTTACVLLIVIMTTRVTGMADWQPVEWRGGSAWVSETDAGRAIVSEARGRLVHFGPAESDLNLLNEVEAVEPYRDGADSNNWGGHRFWLGPQKTWVWPPNPDWEFSAARSVEVTGSRLVVTMPDSEDDFPGLVREYFWERDRLGCRVSWSGTDRPFYGMHVFAVPAGTRPVVRPIDTVDVPLGLVKVTHDLPVRLENLPPGARATSAGALEFQPDAEAIKLGFPPQDLEGRGAGWSLLVSPARVTGRIIHPPDFGFLTQIWVCPEGGDFLELEQISPYLVPEDGGTASSLVFLSLRCSARSREFLDLQTAKGSLR